MRLPWRTRTKPTSSPHLADVALFDLVRSSSEKNRNFFIAFVALLSYVAIAVSSTTDLSLVLPEATLRLPILAVDVPVLLFYVATPLFVVALHMDMLFNLIAHHKKLMAWRTAASPIKPEQIQPFLFDFAVLLAQQDAHSVAGFSAWLRRFASLLASSLVFWLAPVVLSFTAWWFSAYQSWEVTTAHLAFVLGDIGLVLLARRHLRSNDLHALFPSRLVRAVTGTLALAIAAPAIASSAALFALETDVGLDRWLSYNADTGWGNTSVDSRSNEAIEYIAYDPDAQEGRDSPVEGQVIGGYSYDYYYYGSADTFSSKYMHIFSWRTMARHVPRRIDVSSISELRRIPAEALKLRQIEDAMSEQDAWHEFGQGNQSIDLRNRRLRFANLAGVRLRYADLRGASLDGAILTRARLDHAKLDMASFRGATAKNSQFDGASAYAADFSHAQLAESRWRGVEMYGVQFIASDLEDAHFIQVTAISADFRGARATRALFLGSNLRDARFDAASAQDASFAHAQLNGASFFRANLYRTRFHSASVANADFRLSLVQASRWRGATGLAELRGLEEAYASPGKLFVARSATDQLQKANVSYLLRASRIDLRKLHDKLACEVNPSGAQTLLFGDASSSPDAPAKAAKCEPSRGEPATLQHYVHAPSYAAKLAGSLCAAESRYHSDKLGAADTDYWTLDWLAKSSEAPPPSDGKAQHYKPHFPGEVFHLRLQQPECDSLRLRVNALHESALLRKWLTHLDRKTGTPN